VKTNDTTRLHTLLVDDHHLFREGIRLILQQVSPSAEFSHAESCEAALEYAPDNVDLVLLDFHLPGTSEHDAFRAVRDHFHKAAVVIVSGDEDPPTIRQLIGNGASGYIPKSSTPAVLLAALELITAGGSYLPPHILDETPTPPDEASDVHAALDQLSDRQRSVLAHAIQGKINKVIADELNIAEGTVKAHLSAAYRALGANNRAEALYIVTRNEIKLDD